MALTLIKMLSSYLNFFFFFANIEAFVKSSLQTKCKGVLRLDLLLELVYLRNFMKVHYITSGGQNGNVYFCKMLTVPLLEKFFWDLAKSFTK